MADQVQSQAQECGELGGDKGTSTAQPTNQLPISAEHNQNMILVALSFFGTGSYQRIVGRSNGTVMSQQSVSKAIRAVTNALNHKNILTKYIKFPQSAEERNTIKRKFYEKFQIPGVLGCVDGTHVAIIRPVEHEERYFNRKHYHSRNVQIIELSSAEPDITLEETKKVQEEVKESQPAEHSVDTTTGIHEVIKNNVQDKGDWQQREHELLKKIEQLEKIKNERTEDGVKLELKVREEEIDLLKARVRNLETELQAALSKPSGKNHEMIENIKQQHEELLSKARGMIFDKTKMVKNQELQIEALTTQVQSLKDINVITKDLLEIRNSEVKAMEDRLLAMEARFKAEKDRYGLVLQRAQTSTTLNDDLKKEYETQLAIFKELRAKYEQRVQALVSENTKLKEIAALKTGTSG